MSEPTARKKIRISDNLLGVLLVLPAFLIIAVMMLIPLAQTFYISLFDMKISNLVQGVYVGLGNYKKIFQSFLPSFFQDVLPATFYFVFGSVFFQIACGLVLALLLHQKFVKGREFFRAIFILPWITSRVVTGISWRFMYEPRVGVVNLLLKKIGISNVPQWLNSLTWVMPAVIIANVWQGTAFSFIMQTAGLQSIPEEVYEAAKVDGASGWQQFVYITFPLMKPFVMINTILTSMSTVNFFGLIMVMTGGGPMYKTEVISMYMYNQAFKFGYIGVGSAVAVLILLLNLILTLVYMRINPSWSEV